MKKWALLLITVGFCFRASQIGLDLSSSISNNSTKMKHPLISYAKNKARKELSKLFKLDLQPNHIQANASYLNSYSIKSEDGGFFANYKVKIDPRMQQDYSISRIGYDQNQNYHRFDSFQQEQDYDRINGMKNSIVQNYFQNQLINGQINQVTKNNADLNQINQQIQSISTSNNNQTDPGSLFKFGTKTSVGSRSENLWVNSTIVNIDANAKYRDCELYRVNAFKEIDLGESLPKIKGVVSYGGSSGDISSSLNSRIKDNFQWTWQSNFPRDNRQNHTLSINYQISL